MALARTRPEALDAFPCASLVWQRPSPLRGSVGGVSCLSRAFSADSSSCCALCCFALLLLRRELSCRLASVVRSPLPVGGVVCQGHCAVRFVCRCSIIFRVRRYLRAACCAAYREYGPAESHD